MAANYWITTNAKFRPFSYDEMIKPVEKMYTEHKGIEEGLSELQVKAGIWEGLANEQTDPVTYAQYKRYADELRLAANDLAMNGLNATSRQNLFNMKARYATEITPIELWYARRDKLDEEQRKLKAQDPSLMFDNDFSTMSLDRFKENPRLSYTAISGNTIAAKASGMLNNLAKAIETEPQYKSILGGQYFQVAQRTGLNTAQILALAQDNPEVLYSMAKRDDKGNILESEKKSIADLMKLGSTIRGTIHNSLRGNAAYNPNKDNIDSYITEGFLTAGAGGTSYSTMGDQSYLNAAQRQAMSIAATEHAWAAADRENALTPIEFDDGTMADPRDAYKGQIPYRVVNGKRQYVSGTKVGKSGSNGSSNSSNGKSGPVTRIEKPIRIKVKTGVTDVLETTDSPNGVYKDYSELTENQRAYVDKVRKGDAPENYTYYVNEPGTWNREELEIYPKRNVTRTADDEDDEDQY